VWRVNIEEDEELPASIFQGVEYSEGAIELEEVSDIVKMVSIG
jgi:hypothetical protein